MERPDNDVTDELADADEAELGTAAPQDAQPAVPRARRPDELTDRERELLDFEKQWWRHPGAKEQAIRDRFDLSATRYYQLVNALLDRPAALAYDPALVNRLRRLRTGR